MNALHGLENGFTWMLNRSWQAVFFVLCLLLLQALFFWDDKRLIRQRNFRFVRFRPPTRGSALAGLLVLGLGLGAQSDARSQEAPVARTHQTGSGVHRLVLTEGSSITGRVLFHGKPLSHVRVNVVAVSHPQGRPARSFQATTDARGRFRFGNLPPNTNYSVAGSMQAIQPYGAIPVKTVHSGPGGQVTNVGDLIVEPGHRLAGRVVLADGRTLPPHTLLWMIRPLASDAIHVTLPQTGRFDVTNIPTGVLTLSVQVPGYWASTRNASLDPRHPYRLIGRVDRDVTHLVFLLQKGPPLPQFGQSLPKAQQPQNRLLRGATGPQNHSHRWAVSGRVKDRQTGKPIPRFRVIPGPHRYQWALEDAVAGTNGRYTVYLETRWGKPALKVEADGYLPGSTTLSSLNRAQVDFALQKGTGPSGVVLQPDGKPAANTKVALFGGDSPVLFAYLGASGQFNASPYRNFMVTTDAHGHFAFEPQLGMQSLAAASPAGFALVSVKTLATNSVIRLEPYGEIQGVLELPSGLGTNQTLGLHLALSVDESVLKGLDYENSTRTDGAGRFEFKRVPAYPLEISWNRPLPDQNGFESVHLRQVTLKPGQSLELRLKVPAPRASVSHELHRSRTGRHVFTPPKRVPGVEVQGTVHLPNGQPATGIEVALLVKRVSLELGRASLNTDLLMLPDTVARTDSRGNFTLPKYQKAEGVVALSGDGFARVSLASLKRSPLITLQPWGRIAGRLWFGSRPATNQVVMLVDRLPQLAASSVRQAGQTTTQPRAPTNSRAMSIKPLFYDPSAFQSRTDDQGRFLISYLPPGPCGLARRVPAEHGLPVDVPLGTVTAEPGQTTRVEFGKRWRSVRGKVELVGTKTPASWSTAHVLLLTFTPAFGQLQQARTQSNQQQAVVRLSSAQNLMNHVHFPVALSAAGSFRLEGVPPGRYGLYGIISPPRGSAHPPAQLTFFISARALDVPPPTTTDRDVPVDWGNIPLKPFTVRINRQPRPGSGNGAGRSK